MSNVAKGESDEAFWEKLNPQLEGCWEEPDPELFRGTSVVKKDERSEDPRPEEVAVEKVAVEEAAGVRFDEVAGEVLITPAEEVITTSESAIVFWTGEVAEEVVITTAEAEVATTSEETELELPETYHWTPPELSSAEMTAPEKRDQGPSKISDKDQVVSLSLVVTPAPSNEPCTSKNENGSRPPEERLSEDKSPPLKKAAVRPVSRWRPVEVSAEAAWVPTRKPTRPSKVPIARKPSKTAPSR